MTPPVGLVIAGGVLLAFPLILDLRRRPGRRLVRVAAGLVALGALLALGLQPNTTRTITSGRSLLVTAGADAEMAERLVREEGPWRQVYRLVEEGGEDGNRSGQALVGGIGYLANRGVRDTLHVVGDGLRSWEWERYAGAVVSRRPVVPSSRPNPTAFLDLIWHREVRLGGRVLVSGRVGIDPGDDPVTVALSEMGTPVVAVEVDEGGRFELSYAPRETGRRALEIAVDAGPDVVPIAGERIGVSVTDPVTPAVLLLEGSPTFETRYLKDWLGGRGGRVVVRSAISSERFRSEYINGPEINLQRVTRRLLDAFDLVVIDARTWRSLGATGRNTIRTATAEDDLGMLLLPDAPFVDAIASGRAGGRLGVMSARRIGDLDARSVRPRWSGAELDSLALLPALPFELVASPGVRPLVRDELGAVVAAAVPGGGGTVALTLVVESYRWLLQGRQSEYDAYWSHLIDAVDGTARPAWRVAARGPVFVGNPVDLMLTGAAAPGSAWIETPDAAFSILALSRDPYETDRWSGTFWPIQPGWHMATTPGTEEFWFYVNDSDALPDLQRESSRNETRLRAQLNSENGDVTPLETEAPIPLAWFFIAFCVGAGVLWVEPRV